MKKLNIIIPLIILLFIHSSIFGQTVFLEEGFENNGSSPSDWTQEIQTGTAVWDFFTGGALPPGSEEVLPPEAHSGTYNARFYKSSFSVHETFLISPTFSFEFAQKPELRFWHAQYQDQLPGLEPDNSKFNIYYRTPEEGNVWVLLKEYNDATEGWVFDSLPIPDSITNQKYKQIQLGFLGISLTVGFGSCIDDVLLVETDTVTKYIEKVYATQPNLDIIPSGSQNNPILRLRFPVQGNDGQLILDSLVVTALEKAGSVVAPSGVKLFHTISEYFSSENQIGTSQSFVDGKAIFNNINYELPYGNSYVWVTYDIPEDEEHQFKNVKVDAKIEQNSIKVNNAYFPLSDINPNGYRVINESIFFDDYETDKGWAFTGEFERDTALGLGGFYQNPDPDYAKSGIKIIGTDLTGLNSKPGDYELGLTEDEYTASAPTLDCKYFKDFNIQFYRWLNVNFGDTASIEYSLDNGTTWNKAWVNDGLIAEREWKFQQIDLSSIIDRNPSVSIRFGMGPTGTSQYFSGWNIDNFAITGTFVNDDAGFLSLISPNEGCGHVNPEPLEVTIQNFGYSPTNDTVALGFSIDGGASWIMDTIFEVIPKDGSKDFTFSELIDISEPGYHDIMVKTFYTGDEDSRNDLMDTTIFSSPTYSIPYAEDFESNYGYWRNYGPSNTWEYGSPNGSVINEAHSGSKVWMTLLDDVYPNNDSAILESPCFDFTGIVKPIFECQLFALGEPDNDGLALYYSIDGGGSWELIPIHSGTYDWNWYNKATISSLQTAGWDSLDTHWVKTREVLPTEIAGQSSVKFRFVFASNDTIQTDGFAIDDVRIYEAPADAGITALVNPTTSCYLSDEENITVTVENFGIRPITAQDTIFAKAIINGLTTLSDTFITPAPIAIGGTQNFTFTQTHNMFQKKWYHLTSYTKVKGDTAFYVAGVYNDTLVDSVYVMGEPRYSLGPDIGTYNSDTVVLNGGLQAQNGNPFVHYTWKYEFKPDSSGIADNRYFGVPAFPAGEDFLDFTITVENDSGCYAYDTITIIKSQTDIGISAFSGIADACEDNQTPALQVTVENFTSGYTMPTDSSITVGYMIDDENFYSETFILTSDLLPGGTVDYSFTGTQPEFPEDGTFNFKVFTVFNADLNYHNDTMSATYTIWPNPVVDIGPDTLFTTNADSITFDGGAEFSAWLWQDNTTSTQTFDVGTDTTSFYSVKVTSQYGCGFAYDTVNVVADNWVLDSLISPVNSCSGGINKPVSVYIQNNSPNAYAAGTPLNATLKFDTKTVKRTILTPELVGYDAFNYTFDTLFNMTAVKSYAVSVSISPALDINRKDNKVSKSVQVWGIKQVDIGPDTIVTKRADTILLDAGNQFATYKWQDASTASTYQIDDQASSTYWVSVTDFNGCPSSKDTVRIIAYDITLEELTSPEPKCDLNDLTSAIFTIRNTGPDIISNGTSVDFKYTINEGNITTYNYTFPFDLYPDQTKTITINDDFGFEAGQTYDFKVFLDWEKDFFNENDTLTSSVYELPHPSINLGPDIYTLQADTVIIRAPKGFTTYYWQNSSKADTFVVQKKYTSEYWLQVRNAYGCTDYDTVMLYTYDIGVSSFDNLNNCEVTESNTVKMYLKVNNYDTLYAGTIIDASYNFNNTNVNQSFTLAQKISPNDSALLEFTTPITISDTGNYTISGTVSMENEVYDGNNEATGNLRIGAFPVNLGPDINSYDENVTLNAGSGFLSYLWSTGDTDQEIEVSSSGTYAVTTTDVNSCESSDSLKVLFLNPSYEITVILGLTNACSHTTTENVSFILKNTGNDTIFVDSTINITYSLNWDLPVNETYTFINNLTPESEVTIPFTTTADLSAPASHYIIISVSFGEIKTSNDTTINTWPKPNVNLGADIETPDESVILDAGEGFASYLWKTNETTQTIEVAANGDYWVEVSDENGCTNRDTVNVYFLPVFLAINEFISPLKGCGALTDEQVRIVVKNMGQKIVPAGTTIGLGYKFANQERLDDMFTFNNDMQPNANLSYTYTDLLSYDQSGTWNIQFYINFEGMEVDTANYSIIIYEQPEFFNGQDTIRITSYPYTLDPNVEATSYLWNTNETTSTIDVNDDGTYTVTITTEENNCEFEGSVYVKNITGINDIWGQQIKIYPVPAQKELWISIPAEYGKVNISLSDVQGKICYVKDQVETNHRIPLENWEQGVYFLKIHNKNHVSTYQVIKH